MFSPSSAQSTAIQRVYRGHLGRRHFLEVLCARDLAIHRSMYNAMATKIQKVMRGFLSRKFAQDVYKRRAYIATVDERGAELTRAAEANLEQQLLAADEAAMQARSTQFDTLTSNIHHLVGTHAIPSVFQSRLGPEYDATAFDIPMEEHIRDAFHNRQTTLRRMRKQIYTKPAPLQQAQSQSQSAAASISHAQPVRALPAATAISPSPPTYTAPAVRGSSASNRQSRPSSGARLAPLHVVPAPPQSPPHLRSTSSTSAVSTISSNSSALLSSFPNKPADSPLSATQKLPALRGAHASHAGTPSGRTLNAADLYQSKIGGINSPDLEEEKQQLPLALALGGHVSTTPTGRGAKVQSDLAATRPRASPQRKWAQPTKATLQRTEG